MLLGWFRELKKKLETIFFYKSLVVIFRVLFLERTELERIELCVFFVYEI